MILIHETHLNKIEQIIKLDFYLRYQNIENFALNASRNSICNLTFKVLNEIRVAFHNGLSYDYHFIVKELANESECLGENKEK